MKPPLYRVVLTFESVEETLKRDQYNCFCSKSYLTDFHENSAHISYASLGIKCSKNWMFCKYLLTVSWSWCLKMHHFAHPMPLLNLLASVYSMVNLLEIVKLSG